MYQSFCSGTVPSFCVSISLSFWTLREVKRAQGTSGPDPRTMPTRPAPRDVLAQGPLSLSAHCIPPAAETDSRAWNACEAGGLTMTELQAALKADAGAQEQLVTVLGGLLDAAVAADSDGLAASSTALPRFESTKRCPLMPSAYLARMMRYTAISPCNLVVGVIYLQRLRDKTRGGGAIRLTYYNCQRLLLCANMIASKYFDDYFMSNQQWARVGDLTTKEMNALELDMLFALDFDLFISRETYEEWYLQIGQMSRSLQASEGESAPDTEASDLMGDHTALGLMDDLMGDQRAPGDAEEIWPSSRRLSTGRDGEHGRYAMLRAGEQSTAFTALSELEEETAMFKGSAGRDGEEGAGEQTFQHNSLAAISKLEEKLAKLQLLASAPGPQLLRSRAAQQRLDWGLPAQHQGPVNASCQGPASASHTTATWPSKDASATTPETCSKQPGSTGFGIQRPGLHEAPTGPLSISTSSSSSSHSTTPGDTPTGSPFKTLHHGRVAGMPRLQRNMNEVFVSSDDLLRQGFTVQCSSRRKQT